MKLLKHVFFLSITLLCASPVFSGDGVIKRIAETKNSVTLELLTPPYTLVTAKNRQSTLTIEGFHPYINKNGVVLPSKGRLLGIPEGARVFVDVLINESETLTGLVLYSQAVDVSMQNKAEPVVSIGFTGMMRDQPVAQILFRPVQYDLNAAQAIISTRLRVKVRFEAPVKRLSLSPVSSVPRRAVAIHGKTRNRPFEAMMKRELINYSTLGR